MYSLNCDMFQDVNREITGYPYTQELGNLIETTPAGISLFFGTATTKTLSRFQENRFTYFNFSRCENF